MTNLATRIFNRIFGRSRKDFDNRAPTVSPLFQFVDPDRLLPAEKLLRLGTPYGGWIIPQDSGITADSVCYSAGAGEDISFDCALAERFHCRVRIIDPTPRAIEHFEQLRQAVGAGRRFPINNSDVDYYSITPADIERLTFVPVGLADEDVEKNFYLPRNPAHVSCSMVNLQKTEEFFTAQCERLPSIMSKMGDRSIDLLKMDIEGGEYRVLRDLVDVGNMPKLLLVEFDEAHTPLDSDAPSRIKEHIDMLVQAGMNCIAIEGSNATFMRTAEISR